MAREPKGGIGERIKYARTVAGLSQEELAERVNVGRTTVSVWENNRKTPGGRNLQKISDTLGVSVDYLIGRESMLPPGVEPGKEATVRRVPDIGFYAGECIEVPVYGSYMSACAGNGTWHDGGEPESSVVLPKNFFGTPVRNEDDMRPFVVEVDGDSMVEDGIDDGAQVCVNPAAEPYDGDVVLVCLDNQVMVKRIFFDRNGGGELRSASDRYPVKYFSRYDVDNGYYVYYGKVTMALTKIRRKN